MIHNSELGSQNMIWKEQIRFWIQESKTKVDYNLGQYKCVSIEYSVMFYDGGARKLFLHGLGHACKHGWVMLRWEVVQPQIGSNVCA